MAETLSYNGMAEEPDSKENEETLSHQNFCFFMAPLRKREKPDSEISSDVRSKKRFKDKAIHDIPKPPAHFRGVRKGRTRALRRAKAKLNFPPVEEKNKNPEIKKGNCDRSLDTRLVKMCTRKGRGSQESSCLLDEICEEIPCVDEICEEIPCVDDNFGSSEKPGWKENEDNENEKTQELEQQDSNFSSDFLEIPDLDILGSCEELGLKEIEGKDKAVMCCTLDLNFPPPVELCSISNPEIKKWNCDLSLGTVTTVESWSRDDCSGMRPEEIEGKDKAVMYCTGMPLDLHIPPPVGLCSISNPEIKRWDCDLSLGTVTTVESWSRDDCSGMPLDLHLSPPVDLSLGTVTTVESWSRDDCSGMRPEEIEGKDKAVMYCTGMPLDLHIPPPVELCSISNPEIKRWNCDLSLGTVTTVESWSRDDCSGMRPDFNTRKKSSWARLRLLWKTVWAFSVATREFRGANAKVNFLLVEEKNRNPDIKKGNCNQSPSTVTTVESSSRDDCAEMLPDLNTSKKSSWARLRLLWKAVWAFGAATREFRGANAKVNFPLVEEKNRNPDIKENCNKSLSTVTTVESSSRDDCAGMLPDLNTSKRSNWAILRLLWKATRAFASAAKEFHGANAKVNFPPVEEKNRHLDIKKRNCNKSPSTVTTFESLSQDDCSGMLPDFNTSKSSSPSRWPIGLPDGGNIVLLDPLEQPTKNAAHAPKEDLCSPIESLPKKKMVRKSFNRNCRTMSLVSEDHRQHFGRRCEGTAKGLGATRICMKHGINRVSSVNHIHKPHGIHWWPFRQKWARRKGCSLGGERTFGVSSVPMDDILDSRLLFIRMPEFARSSPQALALPDGGKIVGPIDLSSSEFAATNNKAHDVRQDQNGYTTSHYEWKSTNVTSDRQGIAMSLCSVKDLKHHFGCKHKDDVKRLGVNKPIFKPIKKKNIPIFKSTCRPHRIYWRPCRLKNNERKAFDGTNNRAHLVEVDQSGPTVSNLDKETTRVASKRKCITKSVLISEDLQQHYGSGQRDAGKSLCDSLAWNSLEVLNVRPLWEESNDIEHLVPRRKLALQQRWIRPKKSLDLPRTLQMNCPGGFTAQSAGGHLVSLSKKIIVRKTFKRECRTVSVSFKGQQQHFGGRCEGVANRPAANRICEQHRISLVPTVKRIHRQHWIHRSPFRQGNSFGGERPVEVVSVSTEKKLISRLQFLRMSLLGRSSLLPLALPSGSEFPGQTAFSSSELTSTNNRAHPGRQDQCGSSASRLEKERTRETLYREGIASHVFSFGHVQHHFGSKHENDAKILGICLSTFKHITRHHGTRCGSNRIRNNVWRHPEPHREKNLSLTFKTLSTNGHVTMVNDMGCQNPEPNELLPDSFEDLNFWNRENGSPAEIEKTPTFHDSFSGNCCEADICLSENDKTEAAGGSFEWAFQLKGLTTQFTANPNLNNLVFPHPQIASIEMLSENMGSSEDRTKLLASQAEGFLEGHVSESNNLTFPACSDASVPSQLVTTILHTMLAIPHVIPPPTGSSSETFPLEGQSTQAIAYPNQNTLRLPQPQIALPQILNEDMGSSEDWMASQQEPFLEGHVSGSINSTLPTCSGPSLSQQPMPTTPYTVDRIPHMMPSLTLSQDASSVKLKATYRDTIIEFQLPLASRIIELKEEVAMILKLELDSFDVKYKDEEGEGDWILIPCDKDLRNDLQLFSSLVNPVIRLLVVDKAANLTNLDRMELKQPAMFVELGIDLESSGIISDLLRFMSKEIYKKAGKAWTRFYWLYEPLGADRSSLITAMANYLEFDICDLDLRSMSSIPELKNMLLSTPNHSLITIQDIDHCAGMLPNLKNELMVSCLLKYIDGLFSRCGDERIIVFTTNHRDRHDADLVPLVNMDIYIPASSPQPIALPDGGEIVGLESSEQKPLVDFDATNSRGYHSGVLLSSSKHNNMREASKRWCLTESVLSLVDPMRGISWTDFDAPNNGAHLHSACQSSPIMSNLEKKDTGEGLNGDFLSKSVPRLDASTKRKSLLDFDATENKAHLLIAYQSGPVASLLENKYRGEALKRECFTKSILGLEDLQQHSGCRRDDAAKSFAAIYDPGIHMTDSLVRKSFEVLETLRPWEQPRNATDTDRESEIWTQMCLEPPDGPRLIHVNVYARRFRAHLFPSLCHSVCICSIFGEPPDGFVPLLSLRRLTLRGCVRIEKLLYFPRLPQINAIEPQINTIEPQLTKSPRYSRESFSKFAGSSHWPTGLPDGSHIVVLDPFEQSTKNVAHAAWVDQCAPTVSLPEKKMVRKTLKRKCRTMNVIFEIHKQHFGRRCEGSAKSFHATRISRKHGTNRVSTLKRIHKQHGNHQWPFRQKWATGKGYSAGDKRSIEVSSLSMNEKLDSRLQFIHSSQCAKADESGPTVSNSEKGSMREVLKRDSLKDLRQHVGARRKDAAKGLCYSLSWKSFEVLDSLSPGKQSNSIRHLARRRTLTHKHCVRLKKSRDLSRSLLSDCSGELAAPSALGLPDGGHIPSLSENKIVRKTLKRKSRTMSVLSLEDYQQHVGRRWEDDAKFLGAKRICRQLAIDRKSIERRIRRQHGTRRCQFKQSAIDLPDGGHIFSLSKKKIVGKTLKRNCRNMSVPSLQYHQHVDSKWEDTVKSLGAKHIYRQLVIYRVYRAKRIRRQHGFHRWPFQRNWATLEGYFLGDERPVEVISLFMDGKLVSRLQLIHISWLGRFSPQAPALPPGGEIGGPLALSSSQLPSTSNRAQLVGQDRSGSNPSHSENERTREPEGLNRTPKKFTIEDLRPHVDLKRADVAKIFNMSESTFKRDCRKLGIKEWPKLPPEEEIFIPPDPNGVKNPNSHHGHYHDVNFHFSAVYNGTEAAGGSGYVVEQVSELGNFTFHEAAPSQHVPTIMSTMPHPQMASTQIVRENIGSFEDQRNLLAPQKEPLPEGHVFGSVNCPIGSISDLSLSQPMPTTPYTTESPDYLRDTSASVVGRENIGSFIDQRNLFAPQNEPLPEGHLFGSVNGTIGSISGLAPSGAMPTIPHTTGCPEYWSDTLASVVGRENIGRNLLAPQKEPHPEGHVFGSVNCTIGSISGLGLSQPMPPPHTTESPHMLASVVEPLMEKNHYGSFNLIDPSCSNLAPFQPMHIIPHTMPAITHMTPLLTERQDSRLVKLNATYGDDTVKLHLPLTSGIMELRQVVSKQLELGLDSFKVKYKDEGGEWILITCDEEVREHLQLTSSGNQGSKLWVVNKVPNTTDFCGNCECDKCRSLKRKRP